MLKITDLNTSKQLKSEEMADVRGGFDPFSFLASTSMTSKVADVDQVFQLALGQGNAGAVTNNQAIAGGNGIDFAPVHQLQDQYNDISLAAIGNTTVS